MWRTRSTRWPQPNAKKIRLVAEDLFMRFGAMMSDATENNCVWPMEERFKLLAVVGQFRPSGRALQNVLNYPYPIVAAC